MDRSRMDLYDVELDRRTQQRQYTPSTTTDDPRTVLSLDSTIFPFIRFSRTLHAGLSSRFSYWHQHLSAKLYS
jgi:hypothetical protein